ncbi:MAG: 50S ribosomal protein L7ae [Clostridiales bacterium]|nr:50S ribosomal protein L7ae [Clostridiales bacterium]
METQQNSKKIFSLLGLAARGRRVVSGEFMTERAVKDGSAELVIVSSEASANTCKMFANMCEFYHVPIYFFGGKEELGHAMGKEMRASLAVTDEGFARSLEKYLADEVTGQDRYGEFRNMED